MNQSTGTQAKPTAAPSDDAGAPHATTFSIPYTRLLDPAGKHRLVIKSVSEKQRPRR